MTALLVVLSLVLARATQPASQPVAPPPERAAEYVAERIGGHEVRFNRALLDADPALADRVRLHLAADLEEIQRLLPAPALARLADVVIWVERGGPGTRYGRGLGVHWSADWLRPRGYLVAKAGGVEISCAADFVDWRTTQPYMLLHEFAHAYHQRLGGRFPAEVAAAYERAKDTGAYEAVAHTRNAAPSRAYAMTNVAEYFAELSEAYFALNDFYPHTRPQLAAHDPAGMRAVARAWGLDGE